MPTIFTIDRNTFVEVLSDAAVAAGKDNDLPMLFAVHLTVSEDGLITASATNRFIFARRRYQLLDNYKGEPIDLLLPADMVTNVARAFPKPKTRERPAELRIEAAGDSLTVSTDSATATYRTIGEQAVDIDQFIDKWVSGPIEKILLNCDYLAPFGKVTRPNRASAMRLKFSAPNKIVLVEIGEDFVGGIMPAREADGSTDGPA